MGFWDVEGATALGSFTGAGVLDVAEYHPVDGDTTFALVAAAVLDNQENAREISGAGAFDMSISAELLNGGQPGIDAPTSMAPFSAAALLDNFAPDLPTDGDYTELKDPGLLGAWQGARGPGNTLVIAGETSRQLVVLNYSDFRRLRVVARERLPARPIGITSTKRMPPWDDANEADADSFLFVLLDQQESAVGVPVLQCRQLTLAMPVLATLSLTRQEWPIALWGPEDDAAADFIVLAYGPRVEVRSADANMTLLAELQSGVYTPTVLDVRRREDLESTGIRVWHILVFSHSGARGAILEYREIDTTKTVVIANPTIIGATEMARFAGAGSLQEQVLRTVTASAVMSAFTAAGALRSPPSDISGATVMRPFSQDNTGAKHINAIEERVEADVAFEMTTAGDLEIV